MSYLTTLPNSLQIFGIWYTKHQKTPHNRCFKCVKPKNDFLFDFSLSSHFFNWFSLSLLTICFSLPTNVLSLPLSSSDQIPSSSSTLTSNLKRLSLSLQLNSNPNKLLASLFIERQSYGLGCDWLRQ